MIDFGDELMSADEIKKMVNYIKTGSIEEEEEKIVPKKETKRELPQGCKWYSDLTGKKMRTIPGMDDMPIRVYEGYDFVPPIPKNYIIQDEVFESFCIAMNRRQVTALTGNPGTGKTKLPEYYAALTGRPHLHISYHSELLPSDIVGAPQLRNGETRFVMGDLPKFVAWPSVIVHDEVFRATATVGHALLQDHLERFRVKMPENDQQPIAGAHPDLLLVCADNTLGFGDEDGKFGAANAQDTSTLNRIKFHIPVEYMSEAQTTQLITLLCPTLSTEQAKKLAMFAGLCQTAYKGGKLPLTFSIRNIESVVELFEDTRSMKYALTYNFFNALDAESRIAAEGFYQHVWG